MAEIIKKGETAPDFTLDDHDGKPFHLADAKGKKVLLSFHPLAWTGVCARQMQSLERNQEEFGKLGAVAVGVNIDATPTKKAWAGELGLKRTRLLSDFWPHGAVASSLGIFREKDGFSERANVVLDESGKVIFSKIYAMGELPDIDEILGLLRKKYEPPKTPGGG